ncbi:MAG: endo alpha-1,4 polygalactosaminidase [Candidatus Asgardarchaeia archaeon]
MRKLTRIAIILSIISVIALSGFIYYGGLDLAPSEHIDYRQEMRNFIQNISAYAKEFNPDFIVIPQNGHELLTKNGEADGPLAIDYINAIDGIGREELFYGYYNDNEPTPEDIRNMMIPFMDLAENNGVEVLVIDYCWTHSYVDDSYEQSARRGYISFAADNRSLSDIPPYPEEPYNVNDQNITTLSDAKNFLYLINPDSFPTKEDFLEALRETNYDILIIDLFYNGEQLSFEEVNSLKVKANGGRRLVIAYMSIGEAESYRYYWNPDWETNPPPWLAEENPDWPGNYKVRYWYKEWQDIIYGNNSSYLKRIIDAGFDGVYLDLIDAYEYFENQA